MRKVKVIGPGRHQAVVGGHERQLCLEVDAEVASCGGCESSA